MWNRTPFTERFALEHPIVQGPFGGGNSSVALVVAVSEAGALGSLGAVNLSPDEIRDTVRAIQARTRRPFNLNLWLPVAGQDDVAVSAADVARSVARVADGLRALGLPTPTPPERFAWSFDAQIGPLLDAAPPVISFVMGVPEREVIRDAARRGIRTIGTATTVDEAVAIEAAGIDAVVASGSDAGGHRGSFLRPVGGVAGGDDVARPAGGPRGAHPGDRRGRHRRRPRRRGVARPRGAGRPGGDGLPRDDPRRARRRPTSACSAPRRRAGRGSPAPSPAATRAASRTT
jgi:NAD(P)H-dependent flavin oxidoreductase YrpB (nitropropane dioxygenase family)